MGDKLAAAMHGATEASCEVCGDQIVEMPNGQWAHLATVAEAHKAEPVMCGGLLYVGSRNPDAGNFGPDEPCEEVALPGSDTCAKHGWPDEREPDDDDGY